MRGRARFGFGKSEGQVKRMTLTAEQIHDYHTNGFTVVEGKGGLSGIVDSHPIFGKVIP